MKKSIFAVATIIGVSGFFSSCGNKEGEQKEGVNSTDTVVKVDTTEKVAEAPVLAGFAYYDNLAKTAKLEGVTLNSNNVYSDTSSKAFAIGYDIANVAEVGADKINFMAGSVARLGNKSDILNNSLDEFKAVQTKYVEKGVKVADFKEYKKDDATFYYCTFKGKSDMMGGNKNYNQLMAHFVKDDVYLDFTVTVLDKKADLKKAEAILLKMADLIAKK